MMQAITWSPELFSAIKASTEPNVQHQISLHRNLSPLEKRLLSKENDETGPVTVQDYWM